MMEVTSCVMWKKSVVAIDRRGYGNAELVGQFQSGFDEFREK